VGEIRRPLEIGPYARSLRPFAGRAHESTRGKEGAMSIVTILIIIILVLLALYLFRRVF
jgi:hypothetical protein